jgi:uncharacterized protein
MAIVMRRHMQNGQTVIAAADSSILGKKYKSGAVVLDLEKFRSFYEGEETEATCLKKALTECDSANLAGSLSVKAAIGAKLAKKSAIIDIGGVPHLQIYRIPKR